MPVLPALPGAFERSSDSDSSGSSGGISAESLVNNAESHFDVSGTSVLIAWGLTFIGGVICVALFSYARERFESIYYPRIKACKEQKASGNTESGEQGQFTHETPELPQGSWGWVRFLWKDIKLELGFRTSEKIKQRDFDMLKLLGLDAVTFLQYLRLLRWLTGAISILVALPLVALNVYINTYTDYGSTETNVTTSTVDNSTEVLGVLELLTAANIKGNGLYVHIFFESVITCLVYFFVYTHYEHHGKLVEQWASLNYREIAFKSIMLTGLDISHKTREGPKYASEVQDEVRVLVNATAEDEAEVVFVQRKLGTLGRGMQEYKDKLHPLVDQAAAAWKRGDKAGHFGGWAWLHRIFPVSQKPVKTVIHEAAQKIRKLMEEQDAVKEELRSTTIDQNVTAAFVTWKTAIRAHQVGDECTKRKACRKSGARVERAPRNHNVLWKNLEQDPKVWRTHSIIGTVVIVFICVVNTIPVMAITVLANLDTAVQYVPWLKSLVDSSALWNAFFTAVSGVLPGTVSAIFSFALPYLMRFISQWSGAFTRGQLDREVVGRLFISNFVIFSLLGVLYETYLTISSEIGKQSWSEIYSSLGDVPAEVTKAYISESSYWLSWFPIRAAVLCIQLLQIPRWLLRIWNGYLSRRRELTDNELHKLSEPEEFKYSIEYSHIMFAMAVAIVYAPLAPLVLLCGTVYFWIASFIFAHQLTYVENTIETDGQIWSVVINRILVSTVLMQLLMSLTVALKTQSTAMTLFALAPTLLIALLKYQLVRGHSSTARYFSDMHTADDLYKRTPRFEHDLLRGDWLPKWKWNTKDTETLRKMAQEMPDLKEIIPELQSKSSSAGVTPKRRRRRKR